MATSLYVRLRRRAVISWQEAVELRDKPIRVPQQESQIKRGIEFSTHTHEGLKTSCSLEPVHTGDASHHSFTLVVEARKA